MYLFKVEWVVTNLYTSNIVSDIDFYIAKSEAEVVEFKRNSLINAGYEVISIRSSFVPCFVLREGTVTTISELERGNDHSLEEELKELKRIHDLNEELKKIDDFFDSITDEEFEEIAKQVGLYEDKEE